MGKSAFLAGYYYFGNKTKSSEKNKKDLELDEEIKEFEKKIKMKKYLKN